VLSNGEKVPPADMEMAIAFDPLFEQVLVVGEGRSYLTALLVLNADLWPSLAGDYGLDPEPPESLADPRLLKACRSASARCWRLSRLRQDPPRDADAGALVHRQRPDDADHEAQALVSQHRSCGVARRLALRADATCCCPLGWAVARRGATLDVGCAPMGRRSTMVERGKRRSWRQRPGPWRGAPKSA
jgi:hypothetical protein